MHIRLCCAAIMALVFVSQLSSQEARLLRFPATHGNQIVFTYAGDLFTVPTAGGTARKLTNDVGFEMATRRYI
jgi:tricorn protease